MRFDELPYVMGILNVTPDSFSDGGKHFEHQQAVDHALAMVEAGADILDVGGESTRPGSEAVSLEDELGRVIPVIEKIAKWTTVAVSIDTTKAKVAEAALEAGAAIVNDVSALRFDPEMARVVARAQVPLVVMHMRGVPKTMQADKIEYDDLMGEIRDFLAQAIKRAKEAGIREEHVIVDPGIGFGKTAKHNLMILNRLAELTALGRPILVGPSRKAFIGKILDLTVTERLYGSTAAVAAAIMGGAHIIRVHDVKPMREVASVARAIADECLPVSVSLEDTG
jgi:dihydropteroate synthase